jgi:PST family polysaccharide transporter
MNTPTDPEPNLGWGAGFIPFHPNGAFRMPVKTAEVARQAIRGAGVTLVSSGATVAVQIIATIVLGRLLAPADFGVVAMVTTFSLLLTNFGLNGFTEAVLQREEINHTLISNLFWICSGFALLLSLGFAACSVLLAGFYHNPLVGPVVDWVAVAIFATGCSAVHLALLRRAMLFPRISANDIISRAVSVLVSVLLAWAHFRYWALVGGIIAQALSQAIGAWFMCRWIPSSPRRVTGTGSMVRFAFNVYARFTFSYLSRNTDNLLVGWRFGAQTLGFYKKAYDLFALTVTQTTAPLTNVAVSALSRFPPRSVQYRGALLNSLEVTAFVGMGAGACLTLIGEDVIRVVLGPGWTPAGRLFTFFGPGIGMMLLYATHGWIHLSIGRPDRWLRWGIIEYVTVVLLFVLGLHWGPEGVAKAWTMSFWLLTVPALWYAIRPIELGIGPVIAAVWKYAVGSLAAGAGATLLVRGFLAAVPGSTAAFARMFVSSCVFVILYLSSVILLHRGLAPLYLLGRVLREMRPGKRPAQSEDAYRREVRLPLFSGQEQSETLGLGSDK